MSSTIFCISVTIFSDLTINFVARFRSLSGLGHYPAYPISLSGIGQGAVSLGKPVLLDIVAESIPTLVIPRSGAINVD